MNTSELSKGIESRGSAGLSRYLEPWTEINISNVWGYDGNENEEVVKVTVSRLRRKLETDPARPRYIINVPGVGYKFQCKEV